VNLDRRRLVDAKHLVGVEVGLLNSPVVDGDLGILRRRFPVAAKSAFATAGRIAPWSAAVTPKMTAP
jgi:hypothetical protein